MTLLSVVKVFSLKEQNEEQKYTERQKVSLSALTFTMNNHITDSVEHV